MLFLFSVIIFIDSSVTVFIISKISDFSDDLDDLDSDELDSDELDSDELDEHDDLDLDVSCHKF
jgi:hypothetical protein